MIEEAWIDELKIHDTAELASMPYSLSLATGLFSAPPPKTSKRDRSRYHGSVVRSRWYSEKVFQLGGSIEGFSPAHALELLEQLKGAFALGTDHALRFRRSGWAFDERIAFVTDGEFDSDERGLRRVLPWGVTLVAGDPRIYSDTETVAVYDPTEAGLEYGLELPLEFPLVFGVGEELHPHLHVTNLGTVETPPFFELTGPILNPLVENLTTGLSLQTKNLEVALGDLVTIDVARRRFEIEGDLRPEFLDPAMSDWLELAPGENMLMLRGSEMSAGSTQLSISYRDARI